MIATVKIAPFERWCEPKSTSSRLYAGMKIKIDTASMRAPGEIEGISCNGRIWRVTSQSIEKLMGEKDDGNWWACEHVLEMD